jgi:hypothetical protein
MSSIPDYKVTVGQIARTLLYEDSQGMICFCFDIEKSKEPTKEEWTVFLGHQALTGDGKKVVNPVGVQRERIDWAFEKAKEYLLSRGYKVVISVDEL